MSTGSICYDWRIAGARITIENSNCSIPITCDVFFSVVKSKLDNGIVLGLEESGVTFDYRPSGALLCK